MKQQQKLSKCGEQRSKDVTELTTLVHIVGAQADQKVGVPPTEVQGSLAEHRPTGAKSIDSLKENEHDSRVFIRSWC